MTVPTPENVNEAIRREADTIAAKLIQSAAKRWIQEGRISPVTLHQCGLSPEVARYTVACLEAAGWSVKLIEAHEGDEHNFPEPATFTDGTTFNPKKV